MLPELIKGLSAACQALRDRSGDRKQHHKGIPSIMFLHDINICHIPLTMQYCTPGVRHLSIIELYRMPRGIPKCVSVSVHVHVSLCTYTLFKGKRRVYGCITSSALLLLENTDGDVAASVCAFSHQNSFTSLLHKRGAFNTQTTSGCWTKYGIWSTTWGCLQWNDS